MRTIDQKLMPAYLELNGISASKDYHLRTLTKQQLADFGYRETVREEGSAPLGYNDPVATEIDGEPVWYISREGTDEERAAKILDDWRISNSVARVYGELVLAQAGLLAAVEEHFATAPEQDRIWWRATQRWRRNHTAITSAAVSLGLTDEQLDNLFQQAEALEQADI